MIILKEEVIFSQVKNNISTRPYLHKKNEKYDDKLFKENDNLTIRITVENDSPQGLQYNNEDTIYSLCSKIKIRDII